MTTTTNTNTTVTTKEVGLTKVQQTKFEGYTSTSQKIRYLDSLGWSRSNIAKQLGKRYQHVRNVLITPIKGKGY